MAHSKVNQDLSTSILAGSEEIFDYFCQPCSSTKHVEAGGYCQECSEYLCTACIDYHGKLSMSKGHTVLDKSKMHKTKPLSKIQPTDVLTEKCHTHQDKVLEYYCKSHSQVCCSVCLTLDHISCSDKGYIPNMSAGIDKSQEYGELTADLDRLIRELTKRLEKINDDSKNNEKYHSKTLANIKEFRKMTNELLDKIEEETKNKVAKFQQDNVDAIRCATEKCQSLQSDVKTMAVDLEKMVKTGKNNQLFVKVKLACGRKEELERQMNENDEYKLTRYKFYQDEKIQQMKSALSAIWSLSVRQDATPTKARYVREVKVKADADTEQCTINGVAVLTNDRVIVTDWENKNVKLIDVKVNKVVSRLSLSAGPFDITEINPNQVAVAYGRGKEKKIGILTVSRGLSMDKTIKTPDAGIVGLCYNGANFITACQQPSSVKIIDMSGETLSTFSTDSTGEKLFTRPRCIALSRDKDVVYITDDTANTVTSMTLSGHVISVYKHGELKVPRGVAVGKDGAVYVCSSKGHYTVHQLTAAGDLTRIVLRGDQGLANAPTAIAYNDEEDTLLISSYSNNPEMGDYIRLYQLD